VQVVQVDGHWVIKFINSGTGIKERLFCLRRRVLQTWRTYAAFSPPPPPPPSSGNRPNTFTDCLGENLSSWFMVPGCSPIPTASLMSQYMHLDLLTKMITLLSRVQWPRSVVTASFSRWYSQIAPVYLTSIPICCFERSFAT